MFGTRDAALIEPLSRAVRGYDVLTSQLGSHVLTYRHDVIPGVSRRGGPDRLGTDRLSG